MKDQIKFISYKLKVLIKRVIQENYVVSWNKIVNCF